MLTAGQALTSEPVLAAELSVGRYGEQTRQPKRAERGVGDGSEVMKVGVGGGHTVSVWACGIGTHKITQRRA